MGMVSTAVRFVLHSDTPLGLNHRRSFLQTQTWCRMCNEALLGYTLILNSILFIIFENLQALEDDLFFVT